MPLLSSVEAYNFIKTCSIDELNIKLTEREIPEKIAALFRSISDNFSPLDIAVEYRTSKEVSLMLQNGFSCNDCSEKLGIAILLTAVTRGFESERIAMVNFLLDNKADPSNAYRSLFKLVLNPDIQKDDYLVDLFSKLKSCDRLYAERFNAIRVLIREDFFNLTPQQKDRLRKIVPKEFMTAIDNEIDDHKYFDLLILAIKDPKQLIATPIIDPVTSRQKYLAAVAFLHGTPPDYESAHSILTELEHTTSVKPFVAYSRGYCLQFGKGKPKNFKRAVEFYETAFKYSKRTLVIDASLDRLEEMAKAYHTPDFDLAAISYANKQIEINNFVSALACLEPILALEHFKDLAKKNTLRYLAAKCALQLQQLDKADQISLELSSLELEKLYCDAYIKLEETRKKRTEDAAVLKSALDFRKLNSFNKLSKNTQEQFHVLAATCAFSLAAPENAFVYLASCEGFNKYDFYHKACEDAEVSRKDRKLVDAEKKLKLLAERDFGPAHFALAWFEINTRETGSNYLAAIERYKQAALSNFGEEKKRREALDALQKFVVDQEQPRENRDAAREAVLTVLVTTQCPPTISVVNHLEMMSQTRLDATILWAEKFEKLPQREDRIPDLLTNFYIKKGEQLQTQNQALAALEYYQKAALRYKSSGLQVMCENILRLFTADDVKAKAEITVATILLSKLAAGEKDHEYIKIVEQLEKTGCVEAAAVRAMCLECKLTKPNLYFLYSETRQAHWILLEALTKKPESFVLQRSLFNFLGKLRSPDVKQQLFAAASVLAMQESKLDWDDQQVVTKAREFLVKTTTSEKSELKILASLLLSYVEQGISENKPAHLVALTELTLRNQCEKEIAKTTTLPKKIRDLASSVQTAVATPKGETSSSSSSANFYPPKPQSAAPTSGFLAAPSSKPAELPATINAASQPAAPISREVVDAATTTGFLAAPSSKPAELPPMPNAPSDDLDNADTSTKTTVKQAVASLN